jgi:hypothetical protein
MKRSVVARKSKLMTHILDAAMQCGELGFNVRSDPDNCWMVVGRKRAGRPVREIETWLMSASSLKCIRKPVKRLPFDVA